MQVLKSLIPIILIANCGIIPNAVAAEKPQNVIKYRHAIMEAMSSHALAIQMIATNQAGDRQFLQGHADSIANLSMELDQLFPEGTGGDDTEALPEIWNDRAGFAKAITLMQDSAKELRQKAGSDDNRVFMRAFADAGKACKGCHESYRAEEDDHDHEEDH